MRPSAALPSGSSSATGTASRPTARRCAIGVGDQDGRLDAALLDRQICATEADALVDLALPKSEVIDIHHRYLRALAEAVWSDGVLTDDERRDVDTVATLLALDPTVVDQVLNDARELLIAARPARAEQQLHVGGLTLHPGDKVVLTGQMQRGRAETSAQAQAAGLRMMTSVSRKTTVVAADPDSLSGKAEDARALGIPVVNEHTFMRVLHAMS